MKSIYNKKKINYLPSITILKYLLILIIIISLSFLSYNELINKAKFNNLIQELSEKFNYQFKNYEINNLYRVDKIEISNILNKYKDQSIFLLPLSVISESLHSIRWVKSVNLATNLKDKIKVDILEYKPIALYSFNDKIYYFSEEGKIIDKYNESINNEFIIFYGNQAINQANNLIVTLDKIKHPELKNITKAYFINERRWNIKFSNGILVYLSEKNIEDSIKNYIKLIKKLNDSQIISIKSIDIRNNEKAIISFKND